MRNLQCSNLECGTKILEFLLDSCPYFHDTYNGFHVNVKKFVKVDRDSLNIPQSKKKCTTSSDETAKEDTPKTITQLLTVVLSPGEFKRELVNIFKQYLPHMWNVRNDRYQRSLCLEDYPKNTLVILCDFSAVLSMRGQDTLTCHQLNQMKLFKKFLFAVMVLKMKKKSDLTQSMQGTFGDIMLNRIRST